MKQPRPTALSLLAGELDEADVEALLAETERASEASDELDLVCDLVAALEREPELLSATTPLRSELVELDADSTHIELATPRPRPLPLVAALALAAASVLALWLLDREPAWPASLAPPPWLATELRGPDTDPAGALARDFAAAMAPYRTRAWSAAGAALDTFLDDHPEHAPARFYRAVCFEHEAEFDRASRAYRRVADDDSDLLGDHALWRLAHLRLAERDAEAARALLNELVARDGPFAPNAEALLAEPFWPR